MIMNFFKPKFFTSLKSLTPSRIANDILAGLIVAIIALPLSIALALASGATPAQGLYTAIFAGFVIAMLGGSSVNISGPTAAFATIVAGIIMGKHGMEGLIVATLLAGLILILMGVCRLGSLIKYVPTTVTVGFTAGIAVTILVGQIKDFLGMSYLMAESPVETPEKIRALALSLETVNPQALLVGTIGLAILILWPLLGKTPWRKFSLICGKIPPSIIAVAVGILLLQLTPLDVKSIRSLGAIEGGFPAPRLPNFTLDTVIAVLPDAFTIALLAAIESLLSCVVSDGMVGDKHNSNTELIALGAGNICSGIFGGIPATGAIARTAANVKNGGRTPIAGMTHALLLLLCLLFLMPVAELIPMPIIAAILFMVAYNMSEWRHFVAICRQKKATDITVLCLTFLLTVIFNLVVAIIVGLALTFLFYLLSRRKKAPHKA